MAWNRPSADIDKANSKGEQGSVRRSRALIVGAVLGVLAIGAWLLFFPSDTSQPPKSSRQVKRIPVAEQRNRLRQLVEAKTGKEFKPVLPAKPIVPEFYTNKLGEVKRRTGKGSANCGRVTKQIFSNRCERVLGAMLMTPLGQNFYDDDVPEDFVVDFNDSLFHEIKFAPDDTPEERREKELVIAAKEELKRRMDRGEDIVEVVRREKKMLKEKFESYVEFEQGLNKLRAGNASPEEISEYAFAAKKIMDQHDIEMPLSLGEDESEAYKELQRLIGEKTEDQHDEEAGEQ